MKNVSGGVINIFDKGSKGYMIEAMGKEEVSIVKDYLWLENLLVNDFLSVITCEVSKAIGEEFIEKCNLNKIPYTLDGEIVINN